MEIKKRPPHPDSQQCECGEWKLIGQDKCWRCLK
jgi:hypothetical protein